MGILQKTKSLRTEEVNEMQWLRPLLLTWFEYFGRSDIITSYQNILKQGTWRDEEGVSCLSEHGSIACLRLKGDGPQGSEKPFTRELYHWLILPDSHLLIYFVSHLVGILAAYTFSLVAQSVMLLEQQASKPAAFEQKPCSCQGCLSNNRQILRMAWNIIKISIIILFLYWNYFAAPKATCCTYYPS